jgi:two-component system C4-dicarboxylate transport sensor histidine kinase DctB
VSDLLHDAAGSAVAGANVKIEPADLRADIDPALATRAIANLIKNAREAVAGSPSGQVAIHAWLSDDYRLVIDVDDNGEGFSAEAENNLFQPFFSTKNDGMGIGLAVTRQVASAHKGALSMMRSPLGGARLRLLL